MTQINQLTNHYTVNDVAGWPALFQRLQESSGQPIVDIAHAYSYDVSGVGDPKHFYDIRIQSSSVDNHATTYLIVDLGGKPLINDPMHNLRSAEELIETMITLRKYNLDQIPAALADEPDGDHINDTGSPIHPVDQINNFYPIVSEENYLAGIEMLIEAGADSNEERTSLGFSLHGHGNRYNLDKEVHGDVPGVSIMLNGHGVLNIPLPGLISAETMIQQILLANKAHRFASELHGAVPEGYNNFYPSESPEAWKQMIESADWFGDLVNGNPTTIPTGPQGIETGFYVIRAVTRDAKIGLEVKLDGTPLFNYPKPTLRSAEQIVKVILTLRAKFHNPSVGTEFNFNQDNRKPLLASVRTGSGTEVKLFANGVITIQNPGLLSIQTPEAQKLVELLANGVEESFTQVSLTEEE
jgi:hypothetical protein